MVFNDYLTYNNSIKMKNVKNLLNDSSIIPILPFGEGGEELHLFKPQGH